MNEPTFKANEWRIRSNMEIDKILKRGDLVRHVKPMRLKLLGYIDRMQEGRLPKNLLHGHIIGVGDKERSRKR